MKYLYAKEHNDLVPYEVIGVRDQFFYIRRLKATLDANWKPIFDLQKDSYGVVRQICVNQDEQRWVFSSDESIPNVLVKLYDSPLFGKHYSWSKRGAKLYPSEEPVKYHDWNY